MKQGLLQWSPCTLTSLSIPSLNPVTKRTPTSIISASLEQQQQLLSARERRQLRNSRRESKAGYSWREEVEERLIKKPKKRYASWTEELNLDNLALLGMQWWVVRVSRVRGQDTSELLARTLVRSFPDIEFTVYAPAIQIKRKLKNGSLSVKSKPVFPGCVFLKCVLNKELHDFIREVDGVRGFIGSKVGNTKRQINKPRPVDDSDVEAIFQQAKEEQEKADQAFKEEQKEETSSDSQKLAVSDYSGIAESKPKRQSKEDAMESSGIKSKKRLSTGSVVRVVSGTFAEFVGSLKKLNRKTGKATVGFTLFGKESLVEMDVNEIVPETQ